MSTAHRKPLGPLPALIFSSRRLQLPLYLGLIVAQGVYSQGVSASRKQH